MYNYEDDKYAELMIKKLEEEIEHLCTLYNNGSYYDIDGLFFVIKEKQSKLKKVRENAREEALQNKAGYCKIDYNKQKVRDDIE